MNDLAAPFPWFGGKRKVAPIVWQHFGDVDNYVEPFAGSLAVLLGRPAAHTARAETVNDIDNYLANFWRALQAAPDEVARWADWPVNECDLTARHLWLVNEGRARLANLSADPDAYDSAIQKRKQQLDDLQKRREQLDMMVEWQGTLLDLDAAATDECCRLWERLAVPYSVTDTGKDVLGKLVRQYGFGEICECMRISAYQYIARTADGTIIQESVLKAFDYIGRIARNRKRIQDRPYLADLYYIRGTVKSRCPYYFNDHEALDLLEKAHLSGYDTAHLRRIALGAHNWSDWRADMESLLTESRGA